MDFDSVLGEAQAYISEMSPEERAEMLSMFGELMEGRKLSPGSDSKSEFQVIGRIGLAAYAIALEAAGLTLDATVAGAGVGVLLNVLGLGMGWASLNVNKLTPEVVSGYALKAAEKYPDMYGLLCERSDLFAVDTTNFYSLAACPSRLSEGLPSRSDSVLGGRGVLVKGDSADQSAAGEAGGNREVDGVRPGEVAGEISLLHKVAMGIGGLSIVGLAVALWKSVRGGK